MYLQIQARSQIQKIWANNTHGSCISHKAKLQFELSMQKSHKKPQCSQKYWASSNIYMHGTKLLNCRLQTALVIFNYGLLILHVGHTMLIGKLFQSTRLCGTAMFEKYHTSTVFCVRSRQINQQTTVKSGIA